MKKMTKLLALVMAMMIVFTLGLSACGSNSQESADDGQNPVMNFVGNYACDRANILIEATDEENGASATVTWGSSAWENSVWTMSGTFYEDTLQLEYHDCVRTDYVYNENGDVESQEEVYTGGHGFIIFKEGDPLTLTWQEDQEHMADGMVFEYTGMAPEEAETGMAPEEAGIGMANPWSDVDSLSAAAEGAGLESFEVPEGEEISLGEVRVSAYRCMDGLAEAVIEYPASELTIRKGSDKSLESAKGDISGDYGEYKYSWDLDVDGVTVKCSGNRKGEASRTIWNDDRYDYSITALGLGGDDDFGLSEDDLKVLVSGTK